MKALLLATLLLSGCAVQKFDGGMYTKIVQATVTLSPNDCIDLKNLKAKIKDFNNQLDYINIYESGLPNNSNTIAMMGGVVDEAVRFQNVVSTSETVSWTYCDNKIEGIRHTLGIVLKAEAGKPQS
jgi:hypothetical protein